MTTAATVIKQNYLDIALEAIVDLFAGAGGMSTAIEEALGRSPDVAVNHDDDALSMHRVNHPQTTHYTADVFEIDPRAAMRGRPVGLLHLSPDCTHHSQSSAGKPRDRKIRSLTWVGYRWAAQVRPRIVTLENVYQILLWSRLIAKRDPVTKRVVKIDGSVAAPGERVPVQQQFLVPDRRRLGETWNQFVAKLRGLGYQVEWQRVRASDFGAPTIRERLFMVARCDGKSILWPEPTHSKAPASGKKPWRGAHECIDWSIPCPSILDRKRPLKDATLRRIVKGVFTEVLRTATPFIVPIAHSLVPLDGDGSSRTCQAATQAAAFMMQANDGWNLRWPSRSLRAPMSTITTTGSQQQLTMAYLVQLRRHCYGRNLRDPLMTISAQGEHHGLVCCTLSKSDRDGALRVARLLAQHGDVPRFDRMSEEDRLDLVTVEVGDAKYLIVGLGLRMLVASELYRAQGFPDSYVFERGHDGRVFSKTTQVRLVGNSVSPPPATAIIALNAADLALRPVRFVRSRAA